MAEPSPNAANRELLSRPISTGTTNLRSALELLRSLIRLQGRAGTQTERSMIFARTSSLLSRMLPFEMIAFVIFGEDRIDMDLEYVYPTDARKIAEHAVQTLIDKGAFARGLRVDRPLPVTAAEVSSDRDYLLYPLFVEGRILGMFCAALPPGCELENEALSLIEIALTSTCVAFENHRFCVNVHVKNRDMERQEEILRQSFENLRSVMNGTIQTIATIAELRDPYTSGHQERVSRIGRAIGQILGLPSEEVEGIRVAGALHDVGKMQIPSEILCKPGTLTEIEKMLLKTHAQAGYEILSGITFPWPVAEVVFQHHERLDGSGYPRGLIGDDILLEARILGVADIVEAMASHRPYRPALGIGAALAEIRRGKGTVYDPDVVDACLRVFEDGIIELS